MRILTYGGAMWARMPITGLVGDFDFEGWPDPMPVYEAQQGLCISSS